MNEEQRKCQVQVQQRKWPKESKFRYQNHDWCQELGWRKNHFKPLMIKQCLSVWLAPSGIWNQKQQRKNQKTLKPLSNTTLFIQGKMDQKMKRLFKPIIFSIHELFNQLLNILYD